MDKIKAGFVFMSHKAHIHHGAPVAFELSMDKRFEVIIFTSENGNFDLLSEISVKYPGNHCKIMRLRPSRFYAATRYFKKRLYPRLSEIFKRHYSLFSSCDVLLSPHINLDYIMNREREKILYIKLLHGSGDSDVGFSPKLSCFDYIFVSGNDNKARTAEVKILNEDRIKVVGYPKFDLINKTTLGDRQKYFNNNNPIIQYNPHHNSSQTSWYKWGYQVLDFFATHPEYNLIFAPHIKIFGKKMPKKLKKYLSFKNIIIDINSDALIDMTYTEISDVYMGDISSQIYEFLFYPRPCIFLNPNGFKWENDQYFKNWKLGDVLDDINMLEMIIQNAKVNHSKYIDLQKEAFIQKFEPSDKSAGKRAADAIAEIFFDH